MLRAVFEKAWFLFVQCFVFHLHRGLRAGGGIGNNSSSCWCIAATFIWVLTMTGDEIEDAHGDDYETYRIIFDITFFFVVIVILLAIIQGTWRHGPVAFSM